MMDVTYKDFRQFMRILTRHAQLWTEMWVDNTLCHATRVDGFLDFGENEHPIVCQLGGSVPQSLAQASEIVQSWGYDEINLNCGCPSDRVSGKGEFGAALMRKPEVVRDCIRAMTARVELPVTVKCRLGVDDEDTPEFTSNFVRVVAEAGVKHFIIHARKCILKGLTPEQNRKIPPLMYDRVFRLCEEFPELNFTLNGGVNSLEEVHNILRGAPPNLLGVMIGRAAYGNPCILADVDRAIFGQATNPPSAGSRHAVLSAYCDYLDAEHPPGGPAASAPGSGPVQGALKPVLGVFNGARGNKILRQGIDALAHDAAARAQGPGHILRRVLAMLEADAGAAQALHAPLAPAGQRAGACEEDRGGLAGSPPDAPELCAAAAAQPPGPSGGAPGRQGCERQAALAGAGGGGREEACGGRGAPSPPGAEGPAEPPRAAAALLAAGGAAAAGGRPAEGRTGEGACSGQEKSAPSLRPPTC